MNGLIDLAEITTTLMPRFSTGLPELDKTLNGGLVERTATLLAGLAGSGKSTLLLQIAGFFGQNGLPVLYISAEEAKEQIKERANRLGINSNLVYLIETNFVEDITSALDETKPLLLIVDSLQTLSSRESPQRAGTPTQMRLSLQAVINLTRERNLITIIVGHSTKGGYIAGLQTLQHMVDTTLYLDVAEQKRILEVKKNRYGQSLISWTAQMTPLGLQEDKMPSASMNWGWLVILFFPPLWPVFLFFLVANLFQTSGKTSNSSS